MRVAILPAMTLLAAEGASDNSFAVADCPCGCGRPALPGSELAFDQMSLMNRYAERLKVHRHAPGDTGRRADQLLYESDRALAGLEYQLHGEDSDAQWILLGPPAASWMHEWLNEARALLDSGKSLFKRSRRQRQ